MKKLRNLFAVCLLLLIATTATAQTQSDNAEAKAASAAKADVNDDGVVNEADIEEIIEIMKKDNGVKYYWYVGQENPAEMESISPIVTDNSSPGWRLIGTTVPTYSASKMLWEGNVNPIKTGETKQIVYVAIPNSTIKLRDGDGGVVDGYTNIATKGINGVNYYIYQSPVATKSFVFEIY